MIEELHLFGAYAPAGLIWAGLAAVSALFVGGVLQRLPGRILIWRAGLLELALFLGLWATIADWADHHPHLLDLLR